MDIVEQILRSEQFFALVIASLIFFITIILVVKARISFSVTVLLLLFSLVVGLAISNQSTFEYYIKQPRYKTNENQDLFNKQMQDAIANLQTEVNLEKENLLKIVGEVIDIFNQVEKQTQKLDAFIEETKGTKATKDLKD